MEQQHQPQRPSHPPSPVRGGVGGSGSGIVGGVPLSSSSWNSNSSSNNNATTTSIISGGNVGGNINNNITSAAAAAMLDVTRSISMESGGANSIATYGSASSSAVVAASTSAGQGEIMNNSFRASPVPSFRTASGGGGSPLPKPNANASASAAATATSTITRAMPPPPWPTSTTTTTPTMMMSTPQRSTISASTDTTAAHPTHNTTAMTPFAPPLTPPSLVNLTHSSSTTNSNNNNLSVNISITKSGDSSFSASQGGGGGVVGTAHDANVHAQQQLQVDEQQQQQQQQQAAVLLGLEELERQQADVEKRREEEQLRQRRAAEQQQQQRVMAQQQQHQQQQGLPPLPPPHYATHGGSGAGGASHSQNVIPSQIHLRDDEEDTILSSDGLGGGGAGGVGSTAAVGPGVLKRVVSIEKLRGSVNLRLQRLRSWSQDALHRSYVDPATGSSVDSTQPATLTTDEGGDGVGGGALGQYKIMDPATIGSSSGMMIGSTTSQQQQQYRPNVKSSRKMMFPNSTTNNNSNIISEPYLDEGEMKPLVYGYLYKLGRNGHWQRRFFETNGERLTYYKNVKRTTVLATLDLCKVGEIAIDETDPDGCNFTIQVKNRPYYLRAADKARCNDWVIILNRAREARLQVGNIQLATAATSASTLLQSDGGGGLVVGEGGVGVGVLAGGDSVYRSQTGSDDYAQPCIVISALRPRTRALMNFEEAEEDNHNVQNLPPDLLTSNTAQDEEQIEVTKWDTTPSPRTMQQRHHGVVGVVGSDGIAHSTGGSGIGGGTTTIDDDDNETQSMAKWQKRHSTWHVLSVRFLRWARSITHHADACRRENDVMVVPSHVVMASQKQQMQQSSGRAAGATDAGAARGEGVGGGTQQGQGGPQGRNHSAPLPDLMDSTPVTPGAGSNPDNNSTHDRSRANTESPAFGITYV